MGSEREEEVSFDLFQFIFVDMDVDLVVVPDFEGLKSDIQLDPKRAGP